MTHEGEAKVTARCANLTRSSGWIILEGHKFPGLGARPITAGPCLPGSAHRGCAESAIAPEFCRNQS